MGVLLAQRALNRMTNDGLEDEEPLALVGIRPLARSENRHCREEELPHCGARKA
jgi:hypothetical protein